jgi:Protein of unknown function (DUF2630)
MSDESIAARIEGLVTEEHELRTVEVELDRCWDLLRQRRAYRDAGSDPDRPETRDAETVQRYLR